MADSFTDGVKRGYEECAVLLDAIQIMWSTGRAPESKVVAKELLEASKVIRSLKETL